jgi:hypothetical protein
MKQLIKKKSFQSEKVTRERLFHVRSARINAIGADHILN